MKRMTKKLGAIVLALAMCVSLCATAFAAGECTITIENSVLNNTYYAYKIFDATYDSDGNVAYTIKADDPWYSLVTGDEGQDYFTVSKTADANGNYSVQKASNADDDELIEWLKGCIVYDESSGKATLTNGASISVAGSVTGTGATATIVNLDAGYYFVTTTNGSAVSVTTAYPDATIIDKNLVIDLQKEIVHSDDSKSDFEAEGMGEDVNFDVTASVPMYEGENYVIDYTLTDSMSNGLQIELTEGQFRIDETTGKYYLTDEVINQWITLYDGAGKELTFTAYVYNYSFELIGYDVYTDETSGENVHTFSGFELTYYTVDYTKLIDDYNTALEAWIESGGTAETFDFYVEDYFADSKYPVNASIEIKYSAHVTSLEGYENTNVITLDHEVTPWNHRYNPTPGDQLISRDYVYSWELQLLKISGDGEKTPLEGATFKLESDDMKDVVVGHSWLYVPIASFDAEGNYEGYNINDFETTHYTTNDGGKTFVRGEGTDDNDTYLRILTDKTTEGEDTTTLTVEGTTDKDGNLYFEGLGTGTYTLTEIVAPDGYNLLEDPIVFTITWTDPIEDEDGNIVTDGYFTVTTISGGYNTGNLNDGYILSLNIENNAGTELPGTGGIGTTIFYIIGGVLVVGAVVVLVTRRRMTREG